MVLRYRFRFDVDVVNASWQLRLTRRAVASKRIKGQFETHDTSAFALLPFAHRSYRACPIRPI